MNTLLRKLKGALGIGSIWGLATGTVAAVFGGLTSIPTGWFLSSALVFGAGAAGAGLLLGTGFAGLLSLMEGRRTLDELTSKRAALWGFIVGATATLAGAIAVAALQGLGAAAGGMGIPLGVQLTALAAGAVSYGAVTAGLAAATISLAKRGPSELDAGGDGSIGITPRHSGADASEKLRYLEER